MMLRLVTHRAIFWGGHFCQKATIMRETCRYILSWLKKRWRYATLWVVGLRMTSVTKSKTQQATVRNLAVSQCDSGAKHKQKRCFAASHERQKGSTSKGINVDVGRQSAQSKLCVVPKFTRFLPFCDACCELRQNPKVCSRTKRCSLLSPFLRLPLLYQSGTNESKFRPSQVSASRSWLFILKASWLNMANRLDDGLKIAKKDSARAASRCARFNARNKRFVLANESGGRKKKKKERLWMGKWVAEGGHVDYVLVLWRVWRQACCLAPRPLYDNNGSKNK